MIVTIDPPLFHQRKPHPLGGNKGEPIIIIYLFASNIALRITLTNTNINV